VQYREDDIATAALIENYPEYTATEITLFREDAK